MSEPSENDDLFPALTEYRKQMKTRDDEREALRKIMSEWVLISSSENLADAILAAGFRRETRVPKEVRQALVRACREKRELIDNTGSRAPTYPYETVATIEAFLTVHPEETT